MIRDRLPELKQEAHIKFHVSTESLVLIENDEIEECVERTLHPVMAALLKMYSEIHYEIDLILKNVERMRVMTLAVNSKEFNDKIFYKLRQDTVQIGNSVMNKFQTIVTNLPPEDDYSTLARMKRWLYYGFFQHYVLIWSRNEKFFQEYEQKLKNNLKKQSQILNYELSEEEIDILVAHKQTSLYTANFLETQHARKTLQALQERLGELKKLERSIEEVHTLFIRLQTLVIDQGAVMQSIEKHFNDARNYVEEGTKDIREAEIIFKKNRKSKLFFILIAIIGALLLFVMAMLTLSKK